MTRRRMISMLLVLAPLAGRGRALAQGDVLFPGSTAPGDILRGQGVASKGAAVLYLNAAKARSIDADTQIRFNEYVYNSYQEYNRQRSARIARSAAGQKAGLAAVQKRLRDAPTESDIASGDALNVVLVDLANPRIQAGAWESAKVLLPADTARTIPFQYASVGGTLALRRLDVRDAWPVALRYKALDEPRRAYQQAITTLLEQCRGHQLTPEAVEAVGATAKVLGSRADAAIPQASQDYRQVAKQFTSSLERSAKSLTRATYVEDLLGELDGFRGTTIADLIDLMRRYNLHFGPAESPDERTLYARLCPLLREQREALGIVASAEEYRSAQPPQPSAPEARRPTVEQRLVGTWSRISDKRNDPNVRLLPGGLIDNREGLDRWTFDGKNLVMTWRSVSKTGDFARIIAVVSEDGRSYKGTYRNGDMVWGRKMAEGVKLTYRTIELTLLADGSGRLSVDTRPGAQAAEADAERKEAGMPIGDIAGLKGAVIVRLGDGRHRITHDFAPIWDVEDLAGPSNRIDRNQLQARKGVLVLTPIAQQGKTMAGWEYPRRVRLPLTLRVTLDDFDEDGSSGLILNWPNRTLSTNIYGNTSSLDTTPGTITAYFNPDRAKPNEWKQVLGFHQPPDTLIVKQFRLPGVGSLDNEWITPRIGYAGRGELKVRRVELTARLIGSIGIGFTSREGQIVVAQISEGEGSRSGVRTGDAVESVDNVTIAIMAELTARLANLEPGGSITLGVRREGKPLSIRVVAD